MAARAAASEGNEFFKIVFAFNKFPLTSVVSNFSPNESTASPAPK